MLAQLVVSGLAAGCVYALVALGMTVLYRATTVVNFGHGEFFMAGAFAAYVARESFGLPYAAAIPAVCLLLFLLGMAIERGFMRPLQSAPHISLAMMTVALSFLLKGVARFFYGRDITQLPPLIQGAPVSLGGVVLFPQDLLVIGVSLAVVVGFFVFFQKTETGKIIQAASQNPKGAALVGINLPLFHGLMWGTAAATGALAGILIAPMTLVYPDMGGHVLIRAFAAMTLGGFGSLPGAVAGGLTLGVFENLVGGYLSSALVEIAAYLIIIVVLIVRPTGLFGAWKPRHV
jgi:branched-chain amino acid transport system permease protein